MHQNLLALLLLLTATVAMVSLARRFQLPSILAYLTVGIAVGPHGFGLMQESSQVAAFAEFGGGILFLLGFFFRPAAAMMAFTMLVATTSHLVKGQGFGDYSHALEMGVVFFGMMLVGPGRLSIDGE